MALQLDIPDSVANSLRLPATETEPRLRAELAGVSRYKFADLLGERGLPRHYSEDDLAQDLEYASSK